MIHNIVEKEPFRFTYAQKLSYAINAEMHEYMNKRKGQCLKKAINNSNENWFWDKLKLIEGVKFTRQCIWGFRLYDFWSHILGCAIEIDGQEHNAEYDRYRDIYNYLRSGIVVIRVKNNDEESAKSAISFLNKLETWAERRHKLGITQFGKVDLTNPQSPYWDI